MAIDGIPRNSRLHGLQLYQLHIKASRIITTMQQTLLERNPSIIVKKIIQMASCEVFFNR